jgi:hypothetical protein
MKLTQTVAAAVWGLALIAATRGTEISQSQIDQFQKGTATISDVESRLGMPQRSRPSQNGGTLVDYILLDESANAASYLPFARLVAGAMYVHEVRTEFEFDSSGHLVSAQKGQRDMVCPHRTCPPDEMNRPFKPLP